MTLKLTLKPTLGPPSGGGAPGWSRSPLASGARDQLSRALTVVPGIARISVAMAIPVSGRVRVPVPDPCQAEKVSAMGGLRNREAPFRSLYNWACG